jgi:hypothetical protein
MGDYSYKIFKFLFTKIVVASNHIFSEQYASVLPIHHYDYDNPLPSSRTYSTVWFLLEENSSLLLPSFQNQRHFTTNDRSVSFSSCPAYSAGRDHILVLECVTLLPLLGLLSDEKTYLSLVTFSSFLHFVISRLKYMSQPLQLYIYTINYIICNTMSVHT